jgi:hypothetical protein
MWDEFHNPVAIGLDASRFDQHCSHSFFNGNMILGYSWLPTSQLSGNCFLGSCRMMGEFIWTTQ